MMMYGWQKTTTEQARSTFHDCNFRTEIQNWRLELTAHAQIVTYTKSIPKGDNSYKKTST